MLDYESPYNLRSSKMPDPKDYIDDDYVYVKAHVRRKSNTNRRTSWLFNLCFTVAVLTALIVLFFLHSIAFWILLGILIFLGILAKAIAKIRQG